MEKMEIGTKVHVSLKSSDAQKLGITAGYEDEGKIAGSYPLGYYVYVPGRTSVIAIADKYGAVKPL